MRGKRSFTLVEVLVSILIIAIVSTGSYFSFSVLSTATEGGRNQLQAITLAQAALEEVRTVAKDNFDNLENEEFADINQIDYPGFYRIIRIAQQESTEFKRADITVSWQERGNPRHYNLVLFLSRPPEPLPANIHGTVTNANNGSAVAGARVRIVYVAEPLVNLTTFTNDEGYYTFIDEDGNPTLSTGDWNLSVTCSGYYDSEVIPVLNLGSGEDREVNVILEPLPEPAYIRGRIVGSSLSQNVYLFRDGQREESEDNSDSGFVFEIPFEDTDPQCFTILTGYYESSYPYIKNKHCTQACSPHGRPYNHRGWSSSALTEDGAIINCSNPWFGSSATDRICVDSGEDLDLGDISLVEVPTATLTGYVYDSGGNPIEDARVYINWHTGTSSSYRWDSVYTDRNGYYQASVPAEQELFPNNSGYYLRVRARGYVPIVGCCNDTSDTERIYSSWERVGPVFRGYSLTQDFYLSAAEDEKCGNADGYVRNGRTGGALSGVEVDIRGQRTTNSSGYYKFECSQPAYFSIPVGSYSVEASKSGYYYFGSWGNSWYSSRGSISIQENKTTRYEDIRLWPKGYGTIKGKVKSSTGGSISGATVRLDVYTGSDKSTTTDSKGKFEFSNVIETWPTPEVKGDSYYNQRERRHSLDVSYTDAYDTAHVSGISLNEGGTNNLGDIILNLKGQM